MDKYFDFTDKIYSFVIITNQKFKQSEKKSTNSHLVFLFGRISGNDLGTDVMDYHSH